MEKSIPVSLFAPNRCSRNRILQFALCFLWGVGTPAGAQIMQVPVITPGIVGGSLTASLRSEPKTLNPLLAVDQASRTVLGRLNADLIHINRSTQRTEPALATAWSVTPDGRTYTLHLRQGVRFSDGSPFSADDVVFSFSLYLNPTMHAPQRDLLIIGGRPISVQKTDAYTVTVHLAEPYAAAERLFDGLAILPQHLLSAQYKQGTLEKLWPVSTDPKTIAGLGPFRLKKYRPGQEITLERNPYYWKADTNKQLLPYLDGITFLIVPDENAEAIRFEAGDIDLLSRMSADTFDQLQPIASARGLRLTDCGPGLEYNFLLFNLNSNIANPEPAIATSQTWFRIRAFRQAVSLAIDRTALVQIVYQGHAAPLWSPVTTVNARWIDNHLAHPAQSYERARQLLNSSGFRWQDGALIDPHGTKVAFTIVASSSSSQRVAIATLIQQDLSKLGMDVQIRPLEFHSMIQRILKSHDYDTAIMGLSSGDADPNGDMSLWVSTGNLHLWNLDEKKSATPWEAAIDDLMQKQLTTRNYAERHSLYDRVQETYAAHLPFISLVTPNILVGNKQALGNFRPTALDDSELDRVDEIYWRK